MFGSIMTSTERRKRLLPQSFSVVLITNSLQISVNSLERLINFLEKLSSYCVYLFIYLFIYLIYLFIYLLIYLFIYSFFKGNGLQTMGHLEIILNFVSETYCCYYNTAATFFSVASSKFCTFFSVLVTQHNCITQAKKMLKVSPELNEDFSLINCLEEITTKMEVVLRVT